MIQFYLPDIAADGTLPEEEARHCVRVLRKQVGDEIVAVDGKGHRYRCRLTVADPRHAEAEVVDCEDVAVHWLPCIEVAVAPTKNHDRMEWMVEKLTEMGIDRITPLRCEHSERKNINAGRLEKIAVSAMKQSLKATLPRIDDLTNFDDYIAEQFDGEKFICYCDKDTPRVSILDMQYAGRPIRILIGPEGDFSPREAKFALENGYKPVSLGESRLRTETAAIVAVADAHALRRINASGGIIR